MLFSSYFQELLISSYWIEEISVMETALEDCLFQAVREGDQETVIQKISQGIIILLTCSIQG